MYIMAAGKQDGHAYSWLMAARPKPGQKFELITSEVILDELSGVLADKFDFDKATISQYIERIRGIATVVTPTRTIDVIKEDPDDNAILECAVHVNADLIISADKDLLRLKQFEGTQIHHPTNLKYIFPQGFPDK